MSVLLEIELCCFRRTLLDDLLLLIRSMDDVCVVWRGPDWAELRKYLLLRLDRVLVNRRDGTCRGERGITCDSDHHYVFWRLDLLLLLLLNLLDVL